MHLQRKLKVSPRSPHYSLLLIQINNELHGPKLVRHKGQDPRNKEVHNVLTQSMFLQQKSTIKFFSPKTFIGRSTVVLSRNEVLSRNHVIDIQERTTPQLAVPTQRLTT